MMDYIQPYTAPAAECCYIYSSAAGVGRLYTASSSSPRPSEALLKAQSISARIPSARALPIESDKVYGQFGVYLNQWTAIAPARIVKQSANVSTENSQAKAYIETKLQLINCTDAAAVLDEGYSRIALRAVVDAVEDLLQVHDVVGLNELLALAEPSSLRKITSVALLRSSFRVKDKLSSWQGLYARVYAHLQATNQNPQKALRGLVPARVPKLA